MLLFRRGFFSSFPLFLLLLLYSRDDAVLLESAEGHARDHQLHRRGGDPRHSLLRAGRREKEVKKERNKAKSRKKENGSGHLFSCFFFLLLLLNSDTPHFPS